MDLVTGKTGNLDERTCKRNILIFVLGRLVSDLGSAVFKFALSLYILDITGSSVAFSAVLGFSILPGVFVSIFAGVFVDKHDKKKIIVTCDILSGIIILALFAIFGAYSNSIVVFIIFSTMLSVVQAFFSLSMNVSIPSLVKSEDVPGLNSSHQGIIAIINMVGPILGALAYGALGMEMVLLIHGISFIFSGISEMFLSYKKTAVPIDQGSYFEGIRDVFKYLRGEIAIKYLLIIFLIINFVYSPIIAVVLPFTAYTKLDLSAQQYGMVQASWFAGIITGATIISIKKVARYVTNKIFILIQLQAAFLILWFFLKAAEESKWLVTFVFILLLCMMGILNTMSNIPMISHMQLYTPENLRGRVFGVVNSACSAAVPFGIWIYGVVLKFADWSIITSVTGIIIIIIGVFANGQDSLKEFFAHKYSDEESLPATKVSME